MRVGTEQTRLVVLRGNSASGKSSVAAGVRDRFGRGLALVEQDHGGVERVIGADSSLMETVDHIMQDTGLSGLPPLDI